MARVGTLPFAGAGQELKERVHPREFVSSRYLLMLMQCVLHYI
jgi:hypothetical protein